MESEFQNDDVFLPVAILIPLFDAFFLSFQDKHRPIYWVSRILKLPEDSSEFMTADLGETLFCVGGSRKVRNLPSGEVENFWLSDASSGHQEVQQQSQPSSVFINTRQLICRLEEPQLPKDDARQALMRSGTNHERIGEMLAESNPLEDSEFITSKRTPIQVSSRCP